MTTQPFLSSLPFFPLGTVLFPGGFLPLRIFEVRYLDMIGRCHKAGAPFGVVSLTQGSEVRRAGAEAESFAAIGTLAVIRGFEASQSGLLQIECVGTQRFRVRSSELQKYGLWTADVETVADDMPLAVPEDLHTRPKRCAAWSIRWKSVAPWKAMKASHAHRRPFASTIAAGSPTAGASCCPCNRNSSSG